tara:strand:- start:1593 stop:1997 length:405 start_codon:yes stop_codon:yes gene_type:complete
MIINGEGLLLGRLASEAAKAALLGKTVNVVNCEKVIISGNKRRVFENEKIKRLRKGYPLKSAYLSRVPDRFVRRAIRGMVPYKQTRGQEAFKRIMCYTGIPEEFKDHKSIEHAHMKKLPTLQFVTVGEVCKELR